jgi:bacillithiol system protein YtxJ
MEFTVLKVVNQLEEIDVLSDTKPQVIFKHSTSCYISGMAKKSLVRELENTNEGIVDVYYLDLLLHRNLSNAIAERYQVQHQSPQLLLIHHRKCVYNASHGDVSLDKAMEFLKMNSH